MIHDHQDQSGTIGSSVTLRRALRAGKGLALADQNMRIDWRELTVRISRLDESLKNAGVGPRAIVAIPGRNTIAAAAACLGAIATDRCAMLVNPFQPTAAMAEAARSGRPVVMFDKFDPHRWAEAVTEHRPTTTGLPPAMMRMLLDAAIPPPALTSLTSVWSGSAPVKPDTVNAFTERYGLPVLGNYGATEFCGAVATWSLDDYRRFHAERSAATGRIRPSVAHARVRDPNSGEILATGETGILELRVHRVGPEWLGTTDLAHLDADGFLYLHGRADDVIMRGGFKITPDTVVGALRRHPAVRDAAVVGIADRRLGQVPVAVVELRASHRADETQLISFVRESLPAYFAPTAIRIVSALPRTPTMKIDRGAVRALFEA
ncbi:MAG TPA: fatty acid--CoA ligase family protein [Vicinamibacterales bacterium]|nr:fatty acid--CoA ligase family protein [Vicinamibacterales bacterium]